MNRVVSFIQQSLNQFKGSTVSYWSTVHLKKLYFLNQQATFHFWHILHMSIILNTKSCELRYKVAVRFKNMTRGVHGFNF